MVAGFQGRIETALTVNIPSSFEDDICLGSVVGGQVSGSLQTDITLREKIKYKNRIKLGQLLFLHHALRHLMCEQRGEILREICKLLLLVKAWTQSSDIQQLHVSNAAEC